MAKRPTIGENPLDALMPESPLDVLVPDLRSGSPGVRRSRPQVEEVEELRKRLATKEAEVQTLKEEMVHLRDTLAGGQGPPSSPRSPESPASSGPPKGPEPRWVTLRKLAEK